MPVEEVPGVSVYTDELNWMERGACVGSDVNFFPSQPDPVMQLIKEAKAVCATCPVIRECGEWALKHEKGGIWGGMSEKERRRRRRETGLQFSRVGSSMHFSEDPE